jgi:hypothetical protein
MPSAIVKVLAMLSPLHAIIAAEAGVKASADIIATAIIIFFIGTSSRRKKPACCWQSRYEPSTPAFKIQKFVFLDTDLRSVNFEGMVAAGWILAARTADITLIRLRMKPGSELGPMLSSDVLTASPALRSGTVSENAYQMRKSLP